MNTLRRIYIPFWTKTDIREDAISHKVILCKSFSRVFFFFLLLSVELPRLASPFEAPFFSMHSYLLVFWCVYLTIMTIVSETAFVSSRTLSWFFPLIVITFFYFNVFDPFRLVTTAPHFRNPKF